MPHGIIDTPHGVNPLLFGGDLLLCRPAFPCETEPAEAYQGWGSISVVLSSMKLLHLFMTLKQLVALVEVTSWSVTGILGSDYSSPGYSSPISI